MARTPKYPLEPLLQHRERKVDDATTGLGAAVRAREDAEQARRRAERAKVEAEEHAARIRADEAERLARGELTASDLAAAGAWEVGVRSAIADLERAEDRAGERVDAARNVEDDARCSLARETADRDVVAKDRTRFVEGVRRAAEAAEEESAEEAHGGKRKRS